MRELPKTKTNGPPSLFSERRARNCDNLCAYSGSYAGRGFQLWISAISAHWMITNETSAPTSATGAPRIRSVLRFTIGFLELKVDECPARVGREYQSNTEGACIGQAL